MTMVLFCQSGYPVCRQAEDIMIMRGDGLGKISVRLLHSLMPN